MTKILVEITMKKINTLILLNLLIFSCATKQEVAQRDIASLKERFSEFKSIKKNYLKQLKVLDKKIRWKKIKKTDALSKLAQILNGLDEEIYLLQEKIKNEIKNQGIDISNKKLSKLNEINENIRQDIHLFIEKINQKKLKTSRQMSKEIIGFVQTYQHWLFDTIDFFKRHKWKIGITAALILGGTVAYNYTYGAGQKKENHCEQNETAFIIIEPHNSSKLDRFLAKNFSIYKLKKYYNKIHFITLDEIKIINEKNYQEFQRFGKKIDHVFSQKGFVDIYIIGHTNSIEKIYSQVSKINPQNRKGKLRLVYNGGCGYYGTRFMACIENIEADAWINNGAMAYVGHVDFSVSPVFYSYFLTYFVADKYSLRKAVDKANTITKSILDNSPEFLKLITIDMKHYRDENISLSEGTHAVIIGDDSIQMEKCQHEEE